MSSRRLEALRDVWDAIPAAPQAAIDDVAEKAGVVLAPLEEQIEQLTPLLAFGGNVDRPARLCFKGWFFHGSLDLLGLRVLAETGCAGVKIAALVVVLDLTHSHSAPLFGGWRRRQLWQLRIFTGQLFQRQLFQRPLFCPVVLAHHAPHIALLPVK